MELKPGYKMTDAGLIPSDWVDYTVGDLIAFEGGSQPDKSHFKQSWNPGYVRLIQIRDYKSNKYETYVPSKLVRRFCDENDIMIGRYGPPVFQILKGISGAYNVALIKATPTSQLNKKYAYYFLKQDSLFTFVDKLSQRSSGQTGVDLKELKAYPLSLPPTKIEQEAIAEALSDADTLIETLDQLIAKKRQIKQGAMQELLTGKRRLPGFGGEWEVRRLGELADMGSGGTPPSSNPSFYDGEIPWVAIADMTKGGKFISHTERNLSNEGFSNCAAQMFSAGTVLYAMYASLGECSIASVPLSSSQAILGIRVKEKLSNEFLYYYLQSIKPKVKTLGQQGTQANLNKGMVQDFSLQLPPVIEQTAIATILSDMDTELATLESRLAKARQIKQGMMQELLTGRIRLL